ncbi:hypothetical protein [Curtobacterium sp. VKM Ac-1376]|uniref:hypothetical protein n=1 Tax=Curtobacterium sp. VKM Ac-1376 TaxID=123312 RepID=UPI00188C0F2D|nr:hypothetical protein [Curtobacterium sp. VKM Ac-1376]MBF4613752.1 hypothetical protein [Curtobacterium sp. VKM Ac-1376]
MKIARIRLTESGKDRYGKPTFTEATTELDIVGFAPAVKGESEGVEQVLLEYGGTLYLHPGTDVTESDAFTIYGERYEADGPKARWVHPRGRYPGDVLIVRRSDYVSA